MRHFINYCLLCFIVILAVSGLLSFIEPFKLVVTRIHVTFGFGVVVLVMLHIAQRLRYLRSNFKTPKTRGLPSPHVLSALLLAGVLLAAAVWDWWPVRKFIGLGYEARNRATIFRPDKATAYKTIGTGAVMKHAPDDSAHVRVEFEWGSYQPVPGASPQIAIWAENTTGMMINTFFVSTESAYSETISWEGREQPRVNVLPIWRHRYTLLSGIDPSGELDGKTAATPEHSFSIEEYLHTGAKPFYIYAEINLPGDNQPSILFGAYIEAKAKKEYYLLPLVAHSGDQEKPTGHLYYALDELTTAHNIVEKILVRIVRNWD